MAKTPEKPEVKGPAHKIRMGKVVATIWRNTGKAADGTEFANYTVSIVQTYTDKAGDWQESSSFKLHDLADVMQCAYEARKWIRENPIKQDKPAED